MKPQRANSRNYALIEAAAELFASQGYKSTSMRDISKAVGMLPGSIYYHFPSKDDLLLAIYVSGVERITEALEAAVESHDDPWDRLQAGMSAHIRAITQESAGTRVIFKVEPDEVPKHASQLIALRDRFEAQFKALVDDLPLAPWVDRHLLRLMILGAGNHARLWFSPDGGHAPEEIGARFCRLVRDSVCG
ncbi:MAG: TetR/AcrR family transcriptional regulator [Gammaproteobacteria bacterium]|nr:TetR/AcrR family transcriptional regulator [Gammaproteobacteria bacterium]